MSMACGKDLAALEMILEGLLKEKNEIYPY